MPNNSSSRSRSISTSKPAPKAKLVSSSNTPVPVKQTANIVPVTPKPRSSFLGGIFQGFAFGTGSAVAHRVVDGIVGPRHETVKTVDEPTLPELCANDLKAFNECLMRSNNDIGDCQSYFDILQQCKNKV